MTDKPYSTSRAVSDLIFVSGQLPIDPEIGRIPDDIAEQTRLVLNNLKTAVEAAGLTQDNIVKTTVFMTDFDEFPVMNEVYTEFFNTPYPARSAMEVNRLAAGARVEIEAIAGR